MSPQSDPDAERSRAPTPSRFERLVGMAVILAAVGFFVLLVWVGVEAGLDAKRGGNPGIVPGEPPFP